MKKLLSLSVVAILFSLPSFSQNSIVVSNNEFSFDLFHTINKSDTAKSGTNLFASPFSVYNALSMAYDGAAKKTATEMRKVLKFKKDQKASHNEFVALLKDYQNTSKLFTITNAAVAQKDYKFLDSYLSALKDYNAKISLANFTDAKARIEAVNSINNWVSDNTNGKIKDLLSQNDLSELTRLVLLNAIYFNAGWAKEFDAEKTRQKTFYGKNSIEYITNFMNGNQKVELCEADDYIMVKIQYAKNMASMYMIMPNQNVDFDKFAEKFDNDRFVADTAKLAEMSVELSMPKFKIESRYEMKDMLMDMGIVAAFSKSADFSKMNGKSDLQIDQVIHQTFVEVAEKGTEAAAATAVIMRAKSVMPNKMQKIEINRPFIFVIEEAQNNAILFVGKYVKPE